MALHVPMGISFATHPSYPYDSDIYSFEIMGIQTFHVSRDIKIHVNEGYRWRGLLSEYIEEVDLFLFTMCGSYRLHERWTGFVSVTSQIENDDHVKPLQDRMVMTQGVQYGLPYGLMLNLAESFRLNQERNNPVWTRSKNWRIFCGLSLGFN